MSRFAHKMVILLSLASTEENSGLAIGSVVRVDAVPVLKERVTNDPGLKGTTSNESQAEVVLEEILDDVVLGGDIEVGSVETEGSGELGVARVLVKIVGCFRLSVLDRARDTSPESSGLLVRTDDEGGSSIHSGYTRRIWDQFAVLDKPVKFNIPVSCINNGKSNKVASPLGRVASTDGHLGFGTSAGNNTAEEESKLIGSDLALGHGSFEVSSWLAGEQTKAQAHDGADLGLANSLGDRDNLSLISGDASNSHTVEEIFTRSG